MDEPHSPGAFARSQERISIIVFRPISKANSACLLNCWYWVNLIFILNHCCRIHIVFFIILIYCDPLQFSNDIWLIKSLLNLGLIIFNFLHKILIVLCCEFILRDVLFFKISWGLSNFKTHSTKFDVVPLFYWTSVFFSIKIILFRCVQFSLNYNPSILDIPVEYVSLCKVTLVVDPIILWN